LENFFLASTAPIRVAPSEPIAQTDARLFEGIAADLKRRGVIAPKIEIVRALKADLDGNGEMEAVVEAIAAGRDIGAMEPKEPGDFSIVAVGTLTGSSYVVADHIGYTGDGLPSQFGIVALPDFMGSGRFDLAISYAGWEWAGINIYAWTGGSAKFLASADCSL
jgi:hypothetical protein